jgi:hypothetical protein
MVREISMTEEEFWKRRQEGIASLPPRVKPEPDEDDDELLEREYGRLGDKPPPRLTLETIQARGPAAPESHPSADDKSVNKDELSITNKDSQLETLPKGKILMWGKLLTDKPPYYRINKQLAGCWAISNTESCLLGLLNYLMNVRGYASVSYEQLAWWLRLRKTYSPKSMKQMVSRLVKAKFLDHLGSNEKDRQNLVVKPQWRNSKTEQEDEAEIPF